MPDCAPCMPVPAPPIDRAPDARGDGGDKHVVDVLIDYGGAAPMGQFRSSGSAKMLREAPAPFNAPQPLA
eukprot:2836161-Pyramimonas_sp.AAC.1